MKRFTEPPFWEDIIEKNKEPIFESLINNFDIIEKETLRLLKISKFIKLFYKYPIQKSDLKFSNRWFIEKNTRWNLTPIFGAKHDVNTLKRISKNNKIIGKFRIFLYELLAFCIRILCPQITKLLKGYFDKNIILNSTINIIYPDSEIRPHKHPVTNHQYRMTYHLCIIEDIGAELTVGYETRTWKKKQIIAFKNTGPYRHSVIHKGKDIRVILMVEIDMDYLKSYGVTQK